MQHQALFHKLTRIVLSGYPHQVMDARRDDHGAIISRQYEFAVADHTTGGIWLAQALLAVLAGDSPLRGDGELVRRVTAAIGATRRLQRPSGLIDLPKVDFDSPPDTAFLVQMLCPMLQLARRSAENGDSFAAEISVALAEVVHAAAEGIIGRGFRTPNHRWVVCSALSQAQTLFPQLAARPYVDSILAETIDINADGEYSERSTGIYTAVCNRALRMVADHHNRPDLLDHVRSSLRFMADMMDVDGSIPTSLSRRQDNGNAVCPISMADSFLDMGVRDGDGEWLRIGEMLVARLCDERLPPADNMPFWPAELHTRCPELGRVPDLTRHTPAARDTYRFFPASRCWRRVRSDVAALVAADSPQPLAIRTGDIALSSVEIRGSYFHVASFSADSIEQIPHGVRLTHLAEQRAAPGWDLPLNRPVLFDNPHKGFYPIADTDRERHTLPPLDILLDVVEAAHGFDLRLRTRGGVDRIPFGIAFNFSLGGSVRTDQLAFTPRQSQAVFLRSGALTYHSDTHAITVSPGCADHGFNPFGNEAPRDCLRVIIPMLSPIDRSIRIELHPWSFATPTECTTRARATKSR
jgi:hypothetical protein